MGRLTIGIVAEGPRDAEMIEALISEFIPGDHLFLTLQPEMSETEGFGTDGGAGQHGGGWKGVISWCREIAEHFSGMSSFLTSTSPTIDLLVVHVDGDIAREDEVNCLAPCPPINGTVQNLRSKINEWLQVKDIPANVVYCIPCDNVEAWILCAFDPQTPLHNPEASVFLECFHKPDMEISKQGYNRPHRLLKRKSNDKPYKNKKIYQRELIPKVIEEWETVKHICSQAKAFEDDVKSILS